MFKKIVSVFLALSIILCLSACGNKNTSSDMGTSSPASPETFVAPENYSYILSVNINPQFKLYVDENNNVLAVKPTNTDAETFSNNIDFVNKSLENVIGSIVEQANENGFIKENATVYFQIDEQKNEMENSDILTKVISAANQKASELNIEIKAEIQEINTTQTSEYSSNTEPSQPETTAKNESTSKPTESKPTESKPTESKPTESKPTESKTTESKPTESKPTESKPTESKPTESKPTESKPTESKPTESKPTESKPTESKPTESKPTHTHSFSKATCTEPAKCSCGVTQGSALGHKWKEATCKAPKTCSVCKATDGKIGSHKYSTGQCIYCNEKQIINPKTGLKTNGEYYYVGNAGDGNFTLIIYTFNNSFVGVNGVYSTNSEWKENDETISYKGKTYYPVGFGGQLPKYTLTDAEINLSFSEEYPEIPDEYKLIVNYNYDLEVIYSTNDMFKKGDILDLVE